MKRILFFFIILYFNTLSCYDGLNDSYDLKSVVTPSVPDAPVLIADDTFISVAWSPVADAAGYEIWLNTSNNPETAIQPAGSENITDTSFIVNGLANRTAYYIWLKAKNSAGTSDFSEVTCGTPVQHMPGAATVTAGNQQLSLNWSEVIGATAYEVWFSTINDISTTPPVQQGGDISGTSYTLTGLANGTTYYIWLKAKNDTGTSDFGAVSNGTPIQPAPGSAMIVPGDRQLALSWTPVPGATAYEVWYSPVDDTSTPAPVQQGGDIYTTDYIITGLINETKYYVWIKSKSPGATSDFNTSANGTPGTMPVVTTTVIRGNLDLTPFIAGTSARGGGNVTSSGSSDVTDRGLCWNTTGNPTVNNSKISDGKGTGLFSNSTMKALYENTVYYVRAFATNRMGTAYGSEIIFNSGKIFGSDYADGYVFYNDGYGHGLVSAKTDQSTGIQWNNGTDFITTGASSTGIGSGQTNTAVIITMQGNTGSYAAKLCNDLAGSGWFLPSKDELNLMYLKLKAAGIGGFSNLYYWTSSEVSLPDISAYNAWWQFFNDGYQHYTDPYKASTLYVRAARNF